jgi:hypothetical protein
VHALQPGGALLDERLVQPDLGARIRDLERRYPRLRQPPGDQQLAQVTSISPIRLRPSLRPTQRSRIGRLGQISLGADALELLHHEAPARARLDRTGGLQALEPS